MSSLEGIKVLDASQIMAGPYCSMVLSDLGADVIKVEKLNGGDDTRQTGPHINGESVSFFQLNRNKKSIALNLKDSEGYNIFCELIKESDIFIENFRPGVTESLGIDYEAMKKLNPSLIYCSISGYGQTGPYSHKGGFDLVAQGMSGMMSMTGEPNGRPLKAGVAIYDIGAALTATYSILAAYIHKQNSGVGQHVDISLVESGLPWFAWEAAAYFANGTIPSATGSRHRVLAPYQAVKVKDGYMMLGCANQRTWEKFCKVVVERPEWIEDQRFKSNTDRSNNVETLEKLIEDVMVCQNKDYWINKCEEAGVPAGPINDFEEAVNDRHYAARDMVQELEHPVIGKMKMIGIPVKFSETPGVIKKPSPTLGEHTEDVLKNIGFSEDKIKELYEKKVVE